MTRNLLLCLLFMLASIGGLAPDAEAQAQSKPSRIALERQIINAFERDNLSRAMTLIDQYLGHWPNDMDMLYNAACGHAMLGETDEAAEKLLESVRAGFRDFDHMETDPDLRAIRQHEVFLAILEARDQVNKPPAEETKESPDGNAPSGEKQREVVLAPRSNRGSEEFADWQGRYAEGYRYESDPRHRLHFASPLDDRAHLEMTSMLVRQADQMSSSLFGSFQPDWIFVLVPAQSEQGIFSIDPSTPGWYEHSRRMLVTADIGASLRHEFAHVLHWGHMDRIGQRHPMWVQEGLAALYENYSIDGANQRIKFRINERHNIARKLVMEGEAPPWRELLKMGPTLFMKGANRNYPLARSMFEFIAAEGKLEAWYENLVESWYEDKTGRVALEKTFDAPLRDIERSWERWVRARGRFDDMIDQGDASIGISATDAVDGCIVTRLIPGGGAAEAGMKKDDIIVRVGNQTVRSTRELMLAIARRKVGEVVAIRVRRGSDYLDLAVRMKPLGG
jgi:hypothetical protein